MKSVGNFIYIEYKVWSIGSTAKPSKPVNNLFVEEAVFEHSFDKD